MVSAPGSSGSGDTTGLSQEAPHPGWNMGMWQPPVCATLRGTPEPPTVSILCFTDTGRTERM